MKNVEIKNADFQLTEASKLIYGSSFHTTLVFDMVTICLGQLGHQLALRIFLKRIDLAQQRTKGDCSCRRVAIFIFIQC